MHQTRSKTQFRVTPSVCDVPYSHPSPITLASEQHNTIVITSSQSQPQCVSAARIVLTLFAVWGLFWCVVCLRGGAGCRGSLFRQISVNFVDEGENCHLVVRLQYDGDTYQHPHNVRPQLGESVGRSRALCPGLVRRRIGRLITFHNLRMFCVQSHSGAVKLEYKPATRGLITSNKRDVGAKAAPTQSCP